MVSANSDHNFTTIYCHDSNPKECFNITCNEYIELSLKGKILMLQVLRPLNINKIFTEVQSVYYE